MSEVLNDEEIQFIQNEKEKAAELSALERPEQIRLLCSWNGCNDEQTAKHAKAYAESWNVHPSQRFRRWWSTTGWRETEEATGMAQSVRGDDGIRRASAVIPAANSEPVRLCYRAFQRRQDLVLRYMKEGRPIPETKPIDYAADEPVTAEVQLERLRKLKALISKIGTPVAPVHPTEMQNERARIGLRRKHIDPSELPAAPTADLIETDDTEEPIDF